MIAVIGELGSRSVTRMMAPLMTARRPRLWIAAIALLVPWIMAGCGLVPVTHVTVIEERIDGIDSRVRIELVDRTGLVQAVEPGEGGIGRILSVDSVADRTNAFTVLWTACSSPTRIDFLLDDGRYRVTIREATPCTVRPARVREIVVRLNRPLAPIVDLDCTGGDVPTCRFRGGP